MPDTMEWIERISKLERELARYRKLEQALRDVALSALIPTPVEGWQFCRDVARDALAEFDKQVPA